MKLATGVRMFAVGAALGAAAAYYSDPVAGEGRRDRASARLEGLKASVGKSASGPARRGSGAAPAISPAPASSNGPAAAPVAQGVPGTSLPGPSTGT